MRIVLLLVLVLFSFVAYAEGNCPPGQVPIGGQGVQGCAPMGGSGTGGQSSPRPTGKWETRWGAIAEDSQNLSTGASISRKSKRDAIRAATDECARQGGKDCKLRIAYHNQCVAFADPTMESKKRGVWNSVAFAAQTEPEAKSLALARCNAAQNGQDCTVVYSACSMSEFRSF